MSRVFLSACMAAILWFLMFSPWTSGIFNFWLSMSVSACLLGIASLSGGGFPVKGRIHVARETALGLLISAVLWCAFWMGDKVAQYMFSFAGTQIDME